MIQKRPVIKRVKSKTGETGQNMHASQRTEPKSYVQVIVVYKSCIYGKQRYLLPARNRFGVFFPCSDT